VIDKHWKTEPLAEQLGISSDTLRRAAQRGELRPVRLGRDLIWPESEVQRWLDARRQPESVGANTRAA
jgi:excisionase family DNA binding protein